MSRISINNKQSLFCAFLLLYLMRPYFTWSGFLSTTYAIYFATVLFGVLFLYNNDRTKGKLLFPLFLIVTLGYAFNNGYNLIFTLTFIPITFIPFAESKFYKDVYNNFLYILFIIIGISLIIWLLANTGLLHSYGNIKPLNQLKSYDYSVYPLLVMPGDNLRFCAIFDEPGVVGTIMGLILCIQKFDFRDRKNIVFLLAGIVSFSMFFYVIIFLYYIYYFAFVKKNIRKLIYFVLGALILFVLVNKVPLLYNIIGQRFEWNYDTGTFAGNNRENSDIAEYFTSIMGTKDFWLGIDRSEREWFADLAAGESSYMISIIYNGFMFFSAYVLFFLLYAWRHRFNVNSFILFSIVLGATIYQRPGLYHTEYIFLWSCLARFQQEDLFEDNISLL